MDYTLQSAVTHGIRISVRSIFVPEQSSAKNFTYTFAYRIQIRNESYNTVQLIRRHWDIVDALGEKRVVDGDGVVGQQPVLMPGEEHTYLSGCVFRTPLGRMEGFYTMVDQADYNAFEVTIPPFLLAVPFIQN